MDGQTDNESHRTDRRAGVGGSAHRLDNRQSARRVRKQTDLHHHFDCLITDSTFRITVFARPFASNLSHLNIQAGMAYCT